MMSKKPQVQLKIPFKAKSHPALSNKSTLSFATTTPLDQRGMVASLLTLKLRLTM